MFSLFDESWIPFERFCWSFWIDQSLLFSIKMQVLICASHSYIIILHWETKIWINFFRKVHVLFEVAYEVTKEIDNVSPKTPQREAFLSSFLPVCRAWKAASGVKISAWSRAVWKNCYRTPVKTDEKIDAFFE